MRSSCIHCIVRGIDVAVPASEVVRFVRQRPSPPLPMAQPWVGALTVEAGEVLLCLSPRARVDSPEAGEGVAVLMRETVSGLRWALEADRPGGQSTVSVQPDVPMTVPGWCFPKEWLLRGTTDDGREIAWFDVKAAIRGLELAGASRAV